MNKLNFYFWQTHLNPHESGCISELAAKNINCYVNAQYGLLRERIETGLVNVSYGNAEVMILGDEYKNFKISQKMMDKNSVHVFTGIRAFEFTKFFFDEIKKSDALILMLHESRDTRGILGFIRRLDSLLFDYQYRKRIDAILAIGDLGVNWFVSNLYKKDKVFGFFYSINEPDNSDFEDGDSKVIRFAFVGSLIERKNPLLIIDALKLVGNKKIELNFFGTGLLEYKLSESIKLLPENISVNLHGATSNKVIEEKLRMMDLLILPSRWDGWGAVVNEALRNGCDVITSDKCGASCAIKPSYGAIFKDNDCFDLADKIKRLIHKYPKNKQDRIATVYDSRIISGEYASIKIINIVKDLYRIKNNIIINDM